MVKFTSDELRRIMAHKHNIRNMSVIAHVDHDEESNGYPKYNSASTVDDVSKQSGERLPLMTYTSRLTPTGTPRLNSASISPRYSAAGSPRKTSGSASPTTLHEGRGSFSSLYSSSQQSSAASSPPTGRALPGRTPRIDGKEFFRQAR